MQRFLLYLLAFGAALSGHLLPRVAGAQARPIDELRDAVAAFRIQGDFSRAATLLTARDAMPSSLMLNSLADSLTNFVLGGASSADRSARFSAIRILQRAAGQHRDGSGLGGAGSRLFKIASEARDVGDRAAAISALIEQPDTALTVKQLGLIATSDGATAELAVSLLGYSFDNTGGLVALRGLYLSNSVRDPAARTTLARIVKRSRW